MTTLFTFAHPDDETLVAGTIAYLIESGESIVLYYATRGEKGQTNNVCPSEHLGEVRANELKRATEILGENRLIPQDFGDGELPNQMEKLTNDIERILEIEQPNRVVTFPPSGITEHVDHLTIHHATVAAVQNYESEVELWFRIFPKDTEGIVNHIPDDLPISHSFDVICYQEQIYQAMLAHQTQVASMSTIFPCLVHGRSDLLWSKEFYATNP